MILIPLNIIYAFQALNQSSPGFVNECLLNILYKVLAKECAFSEETGTFSFAVLLNTALVALLL